MQIDLAGGYFQVRCSFDERHVPRDAGFDWHPELRRWVTNDPRVALRLQEHLSDPARRWCTPPDKLILPDGINPQTGLPFAYLPFQQEGIRFGMARKDTLIADEPGLGKGHPVTTRIATPTGWKPLIQLQIGDYIIGSAGRAIRVTNIFDRGVLPVFTVYTNDGASVTCDADHLWLVFDEKAEDWETLTTLQVAARVLNGTAQPMIPTLGGPVQFIERDFPVDPRVAAIDSVNKLAYSEQFEFILSEYALGSVAQRVAFLSGIVRSKARVRDDGLLRVDIPAPVYNADLVEAIVQVVRSLGGLVWREDLWRKARLRIELPENIWFHVLGYSRPPTRINRRWKNFDPGVSPRRIVAVRAAGYDEVRCISVNAADNLYVTEDYLVTHNTVQAIGVGNQLPQLDSMLVVCLASHKEMWARMIELWDVHGLSIDIAYGDDLPDSQAVVINYDILERHEKALRAGRWGLLVCDEAHALQNEETKRTLQVLGGLKKVPVNPNAPKGRKRKERVEPIDAGRRIFLSGTPMPSRPKNIWPLVHACDPLGMGQSQLAFKYRYCGAYETGFGLDDNGASNLDELHDNLKSFMSRHLKAEVLPELGPKTRVVIPLSADGLDRKLAAERDAIAEVLRQYEQNTGSLKAAPADLADCILSADTKMFEDYARNADGDLDPNTPLNKLAIARAELALAKIPMIKEHVESLLQSEKKVIVFAYHRAVIQALRDAFAKYDPAVIYGGTPSKKRQAQEDKFQQQDSCRIFIGNYTAAGTGFTLTAARVVVCAELTWLPHELSQAEDRAHRIGQLDNVLVHYLVVVGSLDDALIVRVVRKMEIIERALDGKKVATSH